MPFNDGALPLTVSPRPFTVPHWAINRAPTELFTVPLHSPLVPFTVTPIHRYPIHRYPHSTLPPFTIIPIHHYPHSSLPHSLFSSMYGSSPITVHPIYQDVLHTRTMSDKTRLLVLGASGVTGQQLLAQALQRNYLVTALVRRNFILWIILWIIFTIFRLYRIFTGYN